MPDHETNLRHAAIAWMVIMMVIGAYHRIRSQMSGESLDRQYREYMTRVGRFFPKLF